MNGTIPNQQQEPIRQMEQPEKKGLLKALALLEVGIIEVLFVGIVYPWKSCEFEFAQTGVQ